jgi:hypothetical protein
MELPNTSLFIGYIILALMCLSTVQSITTTSCEDVLRPYFLDNQRRALSLVITFPNRGHVAFAREEVSVRAMCPNPLQCGTIVHNSLMPIAFSDDVTCAGGRVQPFNVQEQRGLFFDPFHLNIYPSGRVTFSPSQSFCRCSLQVADFNLTCHNGHIFGFDGFNNMFQFVFENLTSYTRVGSACTNETFPTTSHNSRSVPMFTDEKDGECMLSVAVVKNPDDAHTYDLRVHNVGKCTASNIQLHVVKPSDAHLGDGWIYNSESAKLEGLKSLKSGETFVAEKFIVGARGRLKASASSTCTECEL